MSTPNFKMEVGPAAVRAPAGHPATELVTVTNAGAKQLDVTASTMHLGGACDQLRFSPAKFSLLPGHSQAVRVTAPGTTGDYLATFHGVLHQVQGISVGGALGSRLVVGHPTAGTTCNAAHAVTASPVVHASAGPPLWMFALIAVVVLALAFVVVIRKIRNRNRRAV